jgi:hypothetical protein
MANPTTNYGFVLPTPTDLVTDLPADFEVALQGVDTQMKTNADAATNNAIQKSVITTTGDVIYASGANTPARLGIGTSGQVLQVSGGLPAWGTAPAGGMTLISTTTLSGASVTLSSIPTGYVNLYLLIKNVTPSANNSIFLRMNGVSTANTYAFDTVPEVSASTFNQNNIPLSNNQIPTGQNLNSFSVQIIDYTNTNNWKWMVGDNFFQATSPTTSFLYARRWGLHNQTAAISSLSIHVSAGTFSAGTALLYGVK